MLATRNATVEPHYSDEWLTLYGGDCREVLQQLPAASVHCVVTSPPYWGLRDYGSDGQLGLEATPEKYVANLVAVFREVKRVLRDDGTLWLNLGDSYAAGKMGRDDSGDNGRFGGPRIEPTQRSAPPGLKPKDLVGIPWRVAFALQADGWYLRSDIIWAKPNPMPESVTDRPTKAHEYLFLLSKSARYFYDQDAVREAGQEWSGRAGTFARNGAVSTHVIPGQAAAEHRADRVDRVPAGRNLRSVWTIATRPYPGAHFAVFPPELPERCVKAGSSEGGVCPECGAPWQRQTDRTTRFEGGSGKAGRTAEDANAAGKWAGKQYGTNIKLGPVLDVVTTGWEPSCLCGVPGHINKPFDPIPATVLDPFAGSGTVGQVANHLSRRAVLIDLNPAYLQQQMKRNAQTPLGL